MSVGPFWLLHNVFRSLSTSSLNIYGPEKRTAKFPKDTSQNVCVPK